MRAGDNELFRLIKSLSKSEKGYFKKYSTIHSKAENNKYIKLFDVIDKLKEYDESRIKDAFKGDKFINQIHVAKNYLYKTILKSLNSYYSESSATVKLNDMISSTMLL